LRTKVECKTPGKDSLLTSRLMNLAFWGDQFNAYSSVSVYCRLVCAFRYGPEDMEVCGLKFQRDLFVKVIQIYPPPPEGKPKTQTKMQERLIKKFGDNAYPFNFQVILPSWVKPTVLYSPRSSGTINISCCGVDFQILAFCAKSLSIDEKISKSSVNLVIRKVQFAPDKPTFHPMAKTIRHFLMSDEPIHLEVSLDKEIYYHNEPIQVSVDVMNYSNKTVKKIKITGKDKNCILRDKTEYTLLPLIENNREKHGVALDGKIKDEDTQLASSTILKEGIEREVWGILVSYKVKVKLVVSG
uniref:Arrestin C-terminal-like domain-containing protein n=1 Tax=Callorhinchus milii TaxID=7868 RepID=A0A4W3I1K8_CALMI